MGRPATNLFTLVNKTIPSQTKSWNGFPCLEWTGNLDKDRYAMVSFKDKNRRVSRLVASLYLNFDLNSSLKVCHHCDNPRCIEHRHFFIETSSDNIRDSINKGRHGIHINSNPINHNRDKIMCIRGYNNWKQLKHRRYCITCMNEINAKRKR